MLRHTILLLSHPSCSDIPSYSYPLSETQFAHNYTQVLKDKIFAGISKTASADSMFDNHVVNKLINTLSGKGS